MIIVIADAAERDLDDIREFIAANDRGAAERVLARLHDVIQRIADGDLKGREVRLRNGRRAHRWSVRPYWVYYRRTVRRTLVLRVYHQARRSLER